MKGLRIRLNHFKSLLNQTLQAQLGRRDKYSQGVAAVTRALITDFDRIFYPGILDGSVEIIPLIDKYCHPKPNCPLCGSKMNYKIGRFGDFYGCSKYPDCRGVRDKEGNASINDALRFYLTQKEYNERLKEKEYEESRFRNLEL